MALKEVHCPNCGSTELTSQTKSGATGTIVVAVCKYCGSHFTRDLSSGEEVYIAPEEPVRTAAPVAQPAPSGNSGCTRAFAVFLYFWAGIFAMSAITLLAKIADHKGDKGGAIGGFAVGAIIAYLTFRLARSMGRNSKK